MLNKSFLSIIIFTLFSCNLVSEEKIKLLNGIPYGLLKQVYLIKHEKTGKGGTCFVIDIDNKQYIITAKHILGKISNNETVKLYSEILGSKWQDYQVKPIYHPDKEIDIIALATNRLVTPKVSFEIEGGSVLMGQEVYFLGFPYAFDTNIGEGFRKNYPFIKKGVFSLVANTKKGNPIFFIDAHNNEGFSGGPIIYSNLSDNKSLHILGIVSGYIHKKKPLYQFKKISDKDIKEVKTKFFVKENSGILISYGIQPILEAIRKNPIGFSLN